MGSKIMENIRYKILLVEDDKLDQAAFTRMIEEQQLFDQKLLAWLGIQQ